MTIKLKESEGFGAAMEEFLLGVKKLSRLNSGNRPRLVKIEGGKTWVVCVLAHTIYRDYATKLGFDGVAVFVPVHKDYVIVHSENDGQPYWTGQSV